MSAVPQSSTPISKETLLEDIPTPDIVAPLFEPITVGRFELKTRAVYCPLTRCRSPGAIAQPEAATYYSERTNAGQLIISEATGVSESYKGYGYPISPGIFSQEQIDAWKPIVKAVHDKGGVFFMQLWHTGRANHPVYEIDGAQPVSSSAVAVPAPDVIYHPDTYAELPYPVPRALEVDEIAKIVKLFRSAARNAIDAGCDGIELHGANGYLIDQFLQDGINNRTDQYGGSIKNRCRFLLEIVKEVTEEIGADRVGLRLGPYTHFLGSNDSDPIALFSHLVTLVNPFGLAYLHFIEPRVQGIVDVEVAENLIPVVEKVDKEKTRVISAGGYINHAGTSLEMGAQTIASGYADLIGYGRWALANPDLLKRIKLGAPLNRYDRNTFYTPGPEGYCDYPFLQDTAEGSKFFV